MKCNTVGELEAALLELFPREDAEQWDKTGLIVGDRDKAITGVCVALDPTIPALDEAQRLGANVLVTHHPPFLQAPETYAPAPSIALEPGALVYEAIRHGIALVAFHTAFDFSERALHALPNALELTYLRTVIPHERAGETNKGYGALCGITPDFSPVPAGTLAQRCADVLGRKPRVWGNASASVCFAVTAQGSGVEAGYAALPLHADCLIVGEAKYHEVLPLSQAGMVVIELGHDVSELPLAHELAEVIRELADGSISVHELDQSTNWVCA